MLAFCNCKFDIGKAKEDGIPRIGDRDCLIKLIPCKLNGGLNIALQQMNTNLCGLRKCLPGWLFRLSNLHRLFDQWICFFKCAAICIDPSQFGAQTDTACNQPCISCKLNSLCCQLNTRAKFSNLKINK